MKFSGKLFVFFFVVIAVFGTSKSFGQTFGQPSYCVNYATNGAGAGVQITFNLPSALGNISSIATAGVNELGVTVVQAINNTTNPRTATLSVRCAANSRCPGKVRVLYGDPNCLTGVDVTVFKAYTQANINSFSAFVFGVDDNSVPNPYAIIADGCADPNELLNLSVVPVVSTTPCTTAVDTYTWSFVDAAGNPLAGWTPLFSSSDNSAVSIRVPSPLAQACTVRVRVGTCAAVNVIHAQLIIRPSASPNFIALVLAANGGSNTANSTNNPNTPVHTTFPNNGSADKIWCLNADFGANLSNGQLAYASNEFTLEALPNESASGVTYTWNIPPGFELVSQTGNRAIIRAFGGSLGASGVIQVNALQANTCRGQFSRLTVQRKLVANSGNAGVGTVPFNTPTAPSTIQYPTIPLNVGTFTSVPAACSSGPTLLEVKQDYTITVPNVPANTSVTWTCSNNTSTQAYWEFRPVGSNKNSTTYSTSIVTTTPSVIGRYRIPVIVPNTGTLPTNTPTITYSALTCGTALSVSPGIKLPNGVRLKVAFTGSNSTGNSNITVQNDNGTTYPPTGCSGSNLRYVWSFQGSYSGGAGSPYNNVEYEGTEVFTDGNNRLSINSPQLPAGTYTGIWRVAVTNGAGGSPCTNCFAEEASSGNITVTVAYPRPGHGGNNPSALNVKPYIQLSPNPATGEVTIVVEGTSESGAVLLRNAQGKVVYQKEEAKASGTSVQLNHLSKGIYTVEYRDTSGQTVSEKLVVQ